MATLERQTIVPAPREEVFAFFSDPRNLASITPPSLRFRIVGCPDRRLQAGDRIRYTIRVAGITLPWISRISEWNEGVSFTDEQEAGPYRRWSHRHILEDSGDGTLMTDKVEYDVPFGTAGRLAAGWFVRWNLRKIFDYRAEAIRGIFGAPSAAGEEI